MFSSLHSMPRTDAEVATQVLHDEGSYRFPMFSANDAVTIGLSIRKRFRASSRHAKGKGLVISVQSIAGHTLFACTVGDLGHPAGISDVSLDSWSILDNMINVVRRTGHSSFYVEKGMGALGKNSKQIGLGDNVRFYGGAFPIWLENAPLCPIAIAACYSGSSQDDHNLVVTTIRDYFNKITRDTGTPQPSSSHIPTIPAHTAKTVTESDWMEHHHSEHEPEHEHDHEEHQEYRAESPLTETEHEIRSIREADQDAHSEARSDARSEGRSEARSEVRSEARSVRSEVRSERSEAKSAKSGRSGRSGR